MLQRKTHSCINVQEPFRDSFLDFLLNVGGHKIGLLLYNSMASYNTGIKCPGKQTDKQGPLQNAVGANTS
jgi:hypothetical protein